MSLRILKIVMFLFASVMLGSCGQKGDLYLPGEKQAAQVSCIYAV